MYLPIREDPPIRRSANGCDREAQGDRPGIRRSPPECRRLGRGGAEDLGEGDRARPAVARNAARVERQLRVRARDAIRHAPREAPPPETLRPKKLLTGRPRFEVPSRPRRIPTREARLPARPSGARRACTWCAFRKASSLSARFTSGATRRTCRICTRGSRRTGAATAGGPGGTPPRTATTRCTGSSETLNRDARMRNRARRSTATIRSRHVAERVDGSSSSPPRRPRAGGALDA